MLGSRVEPEHLSNFAAPPTDQLCAWPANSHSGVDDTGDISLKAPKPRSGRALQRGLMLLFKLPLRLAAAGTRRNLRRHNVCGEISHFRKPEIETTELI